MASQDASSPRIQRAFGAVLRELRESKHLSQEELAHRAKTSQSYLSLLEAGQRAPGLVMLCLLADALGITLAELVTAFESRLGE